MHVIHSETIKGVGLLAGGPYASIGAGVMGAEIPDTLLDELIDFAEQNEDDGKIDPLSNLNGSPVYIIAGENDEAVPPALVELQKDFYDHFGANTEYEIRPIGHE